MEIKFIRRKKEITTDKTKSAELENHLAAISPDAGISHQTKQGFRSVLDAGTGGPETLMESGGHLRPPGRMATDKKSLLRRRPKTPA